MLERRRGGTRIRKMLEEQHGKNEWKICKEGDDCSVSCRKNVSIKKK